MGSIPENDMLAQASLAGGDPLDPDHDPSDSPIPQEMPITPVQEPPPGGPRPEGPPSAYQAD